MAEPGSGSVAARYGATGSFGTGANMAFRRELLRDLGGFDPCLGAGTPTRGGDDLEMFFRVLKAGRALVYEPRAVVRHRHRRDMIELVGQMRDHGMSFSSYVARTAGAYPEERGRWSGCGAGGSARSAIAWWSPGTHRRRPMRRLALAELVGLLRGVRRYGRARLRHGGSAMSPYRRVGRHAVPQRGRGDRPLHREDPADLRRRGHRRRDRRVRQRLDRRARSPSPSAWARGWCTSRVRGYGNAYLKGFASARGRYLVMGDADDTYDFTMIPSSSRRSSGKASISSPAADTSAAATGTSPRCTAGSATRR